MSKKPNVSVIMAVYNQAPYLASAIESILSQTYQDFEFIIVNDASTDESEQIIKSYHDPRIIYRQNKTNLGLTKSLNLVLAQARGQYIARMDGDDLSLPERFDKQLAFMEEHPEIAVCGSWGWVQEENKTKSKAQTPVLHEDIYLSLLFSNAMIHTSVFIRQNVLSHINYDEQYQYAQDYDLWLRLLAQDHLFHNLPECLVLYNLTTDSISKRKASEQERYAIQALIRAYQNIFNLNLNVTTVIKLKKFIKKETGLNMGDKIKMKILMWYFYYCLKKKQPILAPLFAQKYLK